MSYTVHQMLLDSEESYLNTTFWDVQPLFLMVQNGDVESLQNSLHIRLDRFPAGRITRDARKQLDYLAVSLVNTFMIASIQGGVYPPEANAVADQALRRLSMMRNTSDIPDLITEAALCLCGLVTESRRQSTENPHVEKARHFISTHLTQEIRIEDVAEGSLDSKITATSLHFEEIDMNTGEMVENGKCFETASFEWNTIPSAETPAQSEE